MFKFLKNKIKEAVKKFSKEAEEVEEEKETIKEEPKEVEVRKEEEKEEIIEEEVIEGPEEEVEEEIPLKENDIIRKDKRPKEEPKKETFKEKVKKKFSKKISEKKFNELFDDLEISLLESNVAVEVIEKIKESLKYEIVEIPIKGKVEDFILEKLKDSIKELFTNDLDLVEEIKKSEKPYVILFLGVNGSGKTTTIAKVAKMLQTNGLSVVMAAADTFRAAAIDQIALHADKLGVKLIKHDYGSDSAAVAFDTVKHAKAKDIDVVLIDSAGRMHSNTNLMEELKKLVRISNPNMKIFVGESIVGNDCIEQSKSFNEIVGVDGLILTKADVDEKGGTAISISYVLDKPILYLGTGQEYKDIEKFNVDKMMESLGF